MAPSHAEVRLVAEPPSVPAARRFVAEALAGWGQHALAEDVGLCVSELATNATLHSGSSWFHLELEQLAGAVRVAVADSGMGPVDTLARQPELSEALLDEVPVDDPAATGRGMFLVSVLASTWGIDELPVGKRVWAEFHPDTGGGSDGEPGYARVTHSADRPAPAPAPETLVVVRFRQCPAALVVAHDDNVAEYVRELQLIGDRLSEPSFQRLAELMGGYVTAHAVNWDPARILAHEAVVAGRDLVDIDVLADSSTIRRGVDHLRGLIREAESLSRAGKLMTLPAPEPVQQLRDWLTGEFVAQAEDGADPLPWPDWRAGARR
jgi:anti-sigma regulatory factor (Ser/Thr protein kinase)